MAASQTRLEIAARKVWGPWHRRRGEHAPLDPGPRTAARPFPHPPPPPALPNKAPLQSRAAPRRANGQEGSVSPTSLRCLVPGSTTLLGRSVAPAFLTHTGRVHRHLQGGGGKMASTAAPGGGARARTQAQKESLGRREPRGRGGAAAKSRRGASGRLGDPVRHACTAPAGYFQECAGCF